MRRPYPGEEAPVSKAQCTSEGADVDATGRWHESHASYPGTSAALPAPERSVCYRNRKATGWDGRSQQKP